MGPAVREGEAKEEGVHAEDFLEALDDGNRAALADQGRFVSKCGRECALGGLAEIGMGIRHIGIAMMAFDDLDDYARRSILAEVLGDLADRLDRVLVEARGGRSVLRKRHGG